MKKLKECDNLLNVFKNINNPILNVDACTYNLLLNYGERYVLDVYANLDELLLSKYISALYSDKWYRLYLMYTSKYDPITNTDYTETETIKDTHDNTNDFTRKASDKHDNKTSTTDSSESTITTDSTTRSNAENRTTNTNTTNSTSEDTHGDNKNVFAFDGGKSPTEENTGNVNNTSQENVNGSSDSKGSNASTSTDVNKGNDRANSDTTTVGTLTNDTTENRTESLKQDYERKLHKVGNIGVTTPAEMLTKELTFWQWNFYESVVKDVVELTTLKIFD